jgi:Tfp pilus assembly protein PilX
MYITELDMLAVIIALVVSVTLVVTTGLENARLQKRIQRLRSERYEVTKSYEAILADLEAK